MATVRSHFRPEFLNRLDEILLFHRLERGQMGAIVEIQIGRLRRLLEDRKMSLTLEPAAVHWLAEAGYDPVYGARPLKRIIQRRLQNPLAERILSGDLTDGKAIHVGANVEGLTINDRLVEAA